MTAVKGASAVFSSAVFFGNLKGDSQAQPYKAYKTFFLFISHIPIKYSFSQNSRAENDAGRRIILQWRKLTATKLERPELQKLSFRTGLWNIKDNVQLISFPPYTAPLSRE